MNSDKNNIIGSYHLAQSIQVQDGSVVSKTLVNKPAGTVTLFAFAKEQGLSEHAAPFDAQLLVLEGKAEVSISRKRFCCQLIYRMQSKPMRHLKCY
jgi:quercetin dioxygenase-like cupin family protein